MACWGYKWVWLGSVAVLCVLLCRTLAFAYDVPVTSDGPIIDGALGEWGWAPGIDISPAGDGVGLRGAFEGDSDHWADVYLMWDADSLYIAVSVIDNVLDVEHIDAGDNEWKGFEGERKDKMFYFDHLKVFLRGPEQPLGFNLWVAPELEGAKAYAWGGQQRGAVSDTLPLRVASMVKGNNYSYELALPWTWLRLYPEPDMELDALFLLPDSDLPGLKLSKKVVQSNKWIWWKGKVVLRGKPPGLKKPPEPEIAKKIAEHQRQIVVPKVKVNKPAVAAPLTEQEGEQGDVVFASNAVQNANVVETPAEGEAAARGEIVESAPRPPSDLRARLSRQRLARTQALGAPAWVRQLDTDGDLSTRQIDSLYYRLGETLQRLSQENISSRSDGLIMDIAEYAGTWRAQAKVFVVDLLQATLADLDVEAGRVRPAAARAALATKIEEKKVVTFVRGLCAESLKVYGGNKVVATGDLVEKARRKARLSREEMQRLLQALVNEW